MPSCHNGNRLNEKAGIPVSNIAHANSEISHGQQRKKAYMCKEKVKLINSLATFSQI